MNRYTFVLPSEYQNAFRLLSICANAVYNVILSLKDISSIRIFCKDIHEALKYVDEFSLSLSLSTCRSVDALWFSRNDVHVPVSLSLSLSINICKNGLDPDQTRMEFKKEC